MHRSIIQFMSLFMTLFMVACGSNKIPPPAAQSVAATAEFYNKLFHGTWSLEGGYCSTSNIKDLTLTPRPNQNPAFIQAFFARISQARNSTNNKIQILTIHATEAILTQDAASNWEAATASSEHEVTTTDSKTFKTADSALQTAFEQYPDFTTQRIQWHRQESLLFAEITNSQLCNSFNLTKRPSNLIFVFQAVKKASVPGTAFANLNDLDKTVRDFTTEDKTSQVSRLEVEADALMAQAPNQTGDAQTETYQNAYRLWLTIEDLIKDTTIAPGLKSDLAIKINREKPACEPALQLAAEQRVLAEKVTAVAAAAAAQQEKLDAVAAAERAKLAAAAAQQAKLAAAAVAAADAAAAAAAAAQQEKDAAVATAERAKDAAADAAAQQAKDAADAAAQQAKDAADAADAAIAAAQQEKDAAKLALQELTESVKNLMGDTGSYIDTNEADQIRALIDPPSP